MGSYLSKKSWHLKSIDNNISLLCNIYVQTIQIVFARHSSMLYISTIVIPILQITKLRPRVVK